MTPEYYESTNDGPITCIDAIQAALTIEEFAGFCKGNVIKYIWRAGRKGVASSDLQKALDYINMLKKD